MINHMTAAIFVLLSVFAATLYLIESVPVHAQTAESDLPGAPTGVGLERARDSLIVSWTAPSDDGDRPVIAYGVQWQERGQPWAGSTVNLRWTESSPYTVTGLNTGTTYDARVFAQNAVGLSDPSDVVTGRPADRSSAPTEVRVTGGANSSLTVSWTAPSDTGGTPVAHYVVRWKSGEEDWSTDRQADTTSTSYTITSLINGTEYDVMVAPVTDGNLWGASATASDVAGFRPPGAPTGVILERARDSLIVSWTAPSDDGGRSVVSYGVQWQESGQPWAGSTVNLRWTESSPYTVTGLNTGTTYDARVFAQNAVGLSDPSDVVTGRPAGNSVATGMPIIRGTLEVGHTLTASTSGISDVDGIIETEFSYQWIANDGTIDAEIEEATQASYTLTEDEVGKSMLVRVSFVDKQGFQESLTSESTTEVLSASNNPQVAWVGVLTPQEESSMTPVHSGYSVFGSLSGTLTPSEFTWDEASYGILFLVHGGSGLYMGLNQVPTNDFILQIADASYVGSDSTIPSTGVNAAFFWPSPTSVWTVGNPVEVSLSFNDNALPADRLPAPLVAYFLDVPKNHDGQSDLKFRIYFSEGTPMTADALSQHLVVIGGELVNVVEVGSEGRIWALTIRSNHGEDVSVVMPAETDCEVEGAICTEDGRVLSNRIEVIIPQQEGVVHK